MSAARPPEDHGSAEAPGDGPDAGEAPVPSPLGVRRRAGTRCRRQVLGSVAAVAAVVAVALGVGLVVPGAVGDDGRERRADVADGPVADPPVTGTAADFTDPAVWPLLPELPSTAPLLTAGDLAAALPGSGGWSPAVLDRAGSWDTTSCDDPRALRRPGDHGGVAPSGEALLAWYPDASGEAPAVGGAVVEAYRWADGGGAGADVAAAWGQEQVDTARTCDGDLVLDLVGAPGSDPVVRVGAYAPMTSDGGTAPALDGVWTVRASTVGGPTGLRVGATVAADTSEQAAERVSALLARLVDRLTRADATVIEAARHPAARPALSAAHLPEGFPWVSSPSEVDAAPLDDAAIDEGWCSGAPALDVAAPGLVLPGDGWGATWTAPDGGSGTRSEQHRLLRFGRLGDAGGTEAAAAYAEALGEAAEDCAAAEAAGVDGAGLTVVEDVTTHRGHEARIGAVDLGDGTWSVTAVARDGTTVLVLRAVVVVDGSRVSADRVTDAVDSALFAVARADGTVP